MNGDRRQIFAFSGILEASVDCGSNFDLTQYAIGLAGPVRRPRVCYLPTAVGDQESAIRSKIAAFAQARPDVEFSVLRFFNRPNVPDVAEHLLSRDVILVEGGSVVNLLAVWRAHGIPRILRECWERGVVLTGTSAGSLCWHLGGPTDSFRDALDPFTDGLGLLPYSNGVHDDFQDQPRRSTYRNFVAAGRLAAGYASENGVGLHYVGTQLNDAVTIRPGARAWWIQGNGEGGYTERAVPARVLSSVSERAGQTASPAASQRRCG